jgi:predicted enzyme related to lactoylglutathione lyase
MERVSGIGGVFFRARDPEALQRWYADNLGVGVASANYDDEVWRQAEGPTVWAPFPLATDYFGDPAHAWMINFRVRDLDAMLAQLRAAGIAVADPEQHSIGRFARLTDPEGNPIELWEPEPPPQ